MRPTENCLTCQNYNQCNNPDKSFGFRCLSYKNMQGTSASLLLDMIAEDTLTNRDSLLDNSLPVATVGEDEAKKKETELIDYMNDIINNPNPIPKDLKFDDSDLKEFPNFYEWCMSPRGANNPPFARQLAIGIHLFGEYCPNKKCSSPRFGNIYTVPYKASPEMIADNVTFLRYGVCPKCGARRSDLMRDGHLNLYDEFAGAIGQRGGKSAMFSQLAPYVNHKYLKLQNPNRLFGQMENTVLSATFVGLTFARALSLLWTPVLNLIRTSVWYQEYHELLDFYGEKYGVVPYVLKDTFVDYRHRRLRLYPAGPNKRTLRGDTRYLSGIDEAGWFYSGDDDDEERERASGKEVHGALDRSLKTIRMASRKKILGGYDNLPGAYNISISSPSHNKDLIMYLTGLYENSSECLALRLPTWEFNPQYESRNDFKKEYAENYARAERDFGVNPQVNENRAYSQAEVVTIAERAIGENLLDVRGTSYTNSNDKPYTKPFIMRMTANDLPTVVSMDAGEVNNSFSLTLIQRRDGTTMPRVAGVMEIMPIKGTRINFNDMYTDLLEELFRVYNVCGVVTDRWQSTAILNRIESEYGIFTKQISAKPAHFNTFDSYHRPEMLTSYPKPEMPLSEIMAPSNMDYREKYHGKPVAHLLHQFDTVQDVNGVYDKGQGNTDDILRAAVLGINLITDPSFVDKYLKQKVRVVANPIGAIGSMGGMVGGYSNQPTNVGASSIGAVGGSGNQQVDIGHLGASSLGIRR